MKKPARYKKNLRIKWIRGQILQYLCKNAPNPLNAEIIWEVLDLHNYSISDGELLRHLDYLRDKGYIKIIAERLDVENMGAIMLEITPKGTDLVEGTIPDDPGIEVS